METNISNKCKAYTSLKQSKKLAEILPHKSADGTWEKVSICGAKIDIHEDMQYRHNEIPFSFFSGIGVPSWSLAALLNILPTIDDRNAVFCKDVRCDKWHIFYHGTATLPLIDTERYHDIVDACVELIIKLHEQKLL